MPRTSSEAVYNPYFAVCLLGFFGRGQKENREFNTLYSQEMPLIKSIYVCRCVLLFEIGLLWTTNPKIEKWWCHGNENVVFWGKFDFDWIKKQSMLSNFNSNSKRKEIPLECSSNFLLSLVGVLYFLVVNKMGSSLFLFKNFESLVF